MCRRGRAAAWRPATIRGTRRFGSSGPSPTRVYHWSIRHTRKWADQGASAQERDGTHVGPIVAEGPLPLRRIHAGPSTHRAPHEGVSPRVKGDGSEVAGALTDAWESSPYSDAYLAGLASASLDALKLGLQCSAVADGDPNQPEPLQLRRLGQQTARTRGLSRSTPYNQEVRTLKRENRRPEAQERICLLIS